ncbi:hypothetical protein RQP46_010456 [Phenoliferia psychrophenolica]
MFPIGHLAFRGIPRASTHLRTLATQSAGPAKDNTLLYWGGGGAVAIAAWYFLAKPTSAQTKDTAPTKTIS